MKKIKTEERPIYEYKEGNLEDYLDQILDELIADDEEYADLHNSINEIYNNYPTIRHAFESGEIKPFSKDDVMALIKINELYLKAKAIEMKKAYYIGANNNCYYFKNLGLLKRI